MRDFRKLNVWSKAHHLVLQVYAATRSFPDNERYGLTSQMRRAAASVPTNIAEGCGRESLRDFARFLDIAAGSLSELEYQLLLSFELHLLSESDHAQLHGHRVDKRRMLSAYTKRIRASIASAQRSL